MMKKSLVALAALALAGIASAQSSVTLFGIVDAGISYNDTKSNLANGTSVKRSQWTQSNSGYNSSRLGFRGTEDLGGGLAASFWLEAALGNDTGAAGGGGTINAAAGTSSASQLFNRRSTVSLSGAFGEVRIGRDYTATFWNDTVFDPFGTNGVGSNVLFGAHLATVAPYADSNYVRANNTVAYFLPTNLGGFYGQVQYGLAEQVKLTGTNVSNNGRYVGGRFGYANGPVDVALAYGESTTNDVITSSNKVKTANLGASYDFGVVKAFTELSQFKLSSGIATTVLDNSKVNGLLIGATAPIGAGLIRASFSTARVSIPGADPRADKFALGYVHNLSKRTALYATYAHVNNKNFGAILPGISANAGTGSSPLAYGAGTPSSSNGYDFGIRHAF